MKFILFRENNQLPQGTKEVVEAPVYPKPDIYYQPTSSIPVASLSRLPGTEQISKNVFFSFPPSS
jgi:hypothetical protein